MLKGGFPIPFLFDAPGVSREGHLSLFEDKLSTSALLLNIAVFFAAIMLCSVVISRSRSANARVSNRTDA